jgi:type I restriction enzyme S subunit
MKKEWPKVRLGEVLWQVDRSEAIDASRVYRLMGVRWYGQGLFLREEKIGAEIAANRVYSVKPGDFVYNRLFAWKGSFAVAGSESHEAYVSNEFPCFLADRMRLDPYFLLWMFREERAWTKVLGLSTGATPTSRNRLKESVFLALEIPLPPLLEQRRVLARIEELAAQIDEARTLRQQSANEAEAFIVSVHLELAGNRHKKLGEILQLDEDVVSITSTGSYPQVGVKSFGDGLFPKGAVSGVETTYKRFNRLYDGALVLSQVKGWEGAVAICPSELAGWFVSPEYRTFRCVTDEARAGYLAPLVRTGWFWRKFSHATRGVGARRERTRPEQFLQVELPMPDVVKQGQGEALFAEMKVLKRLQTETRSELDPLMPAVLDRAFKGEL